MAPRSGRRPGTSGTRAAILEAARLAFADRGYDAVSVRGIAREAGVDPALVHHYFGSKDRLFTASLAVPIAPADVVPVVLGDDLTGAGERVVTMFLTLWDDEATRLPLLAVLRSAIVQEQMAVTLREFFEREVIARIAERVQLDRPALRATIAAAHMMGLLIARYVLHLEPLASATREEVVALVGPTLDRYLTAAA